jgi:hypothetical protein
MSSPHSASRSPTPPSDAGSDSSGSYTSSNNPTYTPDELAAIFLDFYTFLTTLHYNQDDLKVPPPAGWPHLTREHCGDSKSDYAMEVLRRLPYFDSTHNADVHFNSRLIDYSSIEREHFQSDEWKLDGEEFWSSERVVDPVDLLLIAQGHESCGRNLILIVHEGEIIEDMIRCGVVGSYDIKSYFEDLKDAYRSLKLLPCIGRNTIDAHSVIDRPSTITEEEYRAQPTDRWGTELDIQYVRQIFRQYGWPHAFRKDDANKAIDELMDRLEQAGRDRWIGSG